jgi:signal transduction histidine kinase
MFNKLRLRLTLINLAIIAALFLILICGTYAFARHQMYSVAHSVMADMISDSEKMENKHPHPPGPRHGPPKPPLFFVKTDAAGKIILYPPDQPLAIDKLHDLTAAAIFDRQNEGEVEIDGIHYAFMKKTNYNSTGMIVVFQELEHEKALLRILILALAGTGLICLAISFFASRFMAGRAMVPIEKAWQQQQDFLADASHELRTPLAVIQANLEVIRLSRNEIVASQELWLDNIKAESYHMAKLVESLLFLARADAGGQVLEKSEFCLDKTLLAAVEPFIPMVVDKKIELKVELDKQIEYQGDQTKIRQLVMILLDNAVKHTPAKGTIKLGLKRGKNSVVLMVADTGEGIAKELQEKIFDRFFQADMARSTDGTGLGLAIAKWIAESHGGRIKVASSPGAGSIFSVELPISYRKNIK